jgi:NTP pyrophosphatase (non-canonical NTP hydrolase)
VDVDELSCETWAMSELSELQQLILRFRDERDWAQFHTPHQLAMSVSVEASELLQLFQWKGPDEVDRERIGEELSDVLSSMLLLAAHYGIDLRAAFLDKMEKNVRKYPFETSFGSNKKWSDPR